MKYGKVFIEYFLATSLLIFTMKIMEAPFFLVALFAVLGYGCCLLTVIVKIIDISDNKNKAIKAKEAEAKARWEAKQKFYEECKKAGIGSLDTPEKQEKAKLIASGLGIKDGTELFARFNEVMEEAEKAEEREKWWRQQEIIRKEKKQYSEMTKYASRSGRDKRIQILTDLRDQKRREISESYNSKNGRVR